MFLTRAAILSILLAGSDAFSPSKLGRGVSMSLKSSAGILSSPAEVEKPEQKEDGDEEKKETDISIPYDATVRLAYKAIDESTPYEEFKVKYLADAVADVVAKKPVDISVPYEATIQLAFEASDRSMSYEDFKPKYLADAVADVVAKQSGDQSADAAPVTASVEEQEVQEASTEEQETSASDGEQETEEVTASNDEASATDGEAEETEVVTASNDEETESDVDEAQANEEVTASNEEGASSEEEEKNDEIEYYKRPEDAKDEEEEEKEDDVVYYKRNPVKDEDLYIWKPKNEAEKTVSDEKRKEREGRYILKKNEEKSIYVKNLDRSKKTKPEKKKFVRKTREEKKAEKDEKKAARKARTGRRALTIRKKTPVETTKVGVEAKKGVKMSTDNEGLFAPAVLLTKEIIGITELNKLRGKIIKMHSEVIGGLTETAQSEFGNQVLKVLFTVADKDKNGTIDEEELTIALKTLGFDFLKEKEIARIFDKADGDKNGTLDLEEWTEAAPMTLKKNLTKLAKKNGHDLGFLAK